MKKKNILKVLCIFVICILFLPVWYINIQKSDGSTDDTKSFKYSDISKFKNMDELIIFDKRGFEITKLIDNELFVFIEYSKDDKWILLESSIMADAYASDIALENNTYSFDECTIMDMDATIFELTTEIGLTTITITWTSDTMDYRLDTNYSKEEALKIIKKLKYYKK